MCFLQEAAGELGGAASGLLLWSVGFVATEASPGDSGAETGHVCCLGGLGWLDSSPMGSLCSSAAGT